MAPILGIAGAGLSRVLADPASFVQKALQAGVVVVGVGGIALGYYGYRIHSGGNLEGRKFNVLGSDWTVSKPNEGSGGSNGDGGNGSGDSTDDGTPYTASSGSLREWIIDGFELSGAFPADDANIQAMRSRIMQESDGNPEAVNNWDSNAARGTPSKGLVQIIKPTWEANAPSQYRNFEKYWMKPRISVATSLNYMKRRYGRVVGANGRGY